MATVASQELFGTDLTLWLESHVPALIERPNPQMPGLNVVLLGQFSNWPGIKRTREEMAGFGFNVMAPVGEEPVPDGDGFVLLDADLPRVRVVEERLGYSLEPKQKAEVVEALFLCAVRGADICYVVPDERPGLDDGGYVGGQVAAEMGVASASGRVVLGGPLSPTLDERDGGDSHWRYFCRGFSVMTPQELRQTLVGRYPIQGNLL